MTVLTDRAQLAAVDTYDAIHRSLLEDARQADLEEYHGLARQIRYQAALVARAARSEEAEPRSLASHDDDAREGWR